MLDSLAEFRPGSIVNILRRCKTFADSPSFDLERIAGLTIRKTLAKGDYLFHEGTAVHGFYIVERGAIKLHRVNFCGKEQVIHVFRSGESFAEESLVSELGHLADACAVEDSRVLMVQRAGFIDLLKHRPELTLCLFRAISQHVHLLVNLLDDLTLKDVKTRLANWLIHHCPDPDSAKPWRIELPMTKRVLAAELGTVSETFSRTVAVFRDEKLLAIKGKTIILLCPCKLAQLLRHYLGQTPAPAASSFWDHAPVRRRSVKPRRISKPNLTGPRLRKPVLKRSSRISVT